MANLIYISLITQMLGEGWIQGLGVDGLGGVDISMIILGYDPLLVPSDHHMLHCILSLAFLGFTFLLILLFLICLGIYLLLVFVVILLVLLLHFYCCFIVFLELVVVGFVLILVVCSISYCWTGLHLLAMTYILNSLLLLFNHSHR